jgi:hypothetical protein
MMITPRAELTLYSGLCTDTVSEGGFHYNMTGLGAEGMNERIITAVKLVNHALTEYRPGVFQFHSEYEKLVKTDAEAEFLIDFAEKNIPKSERWIHLIECSHGAIVFYKKIVFPGYTADQQQELIDALKKSGHDPYDSSLESMIRMGSSICHSEEERAKWKKEVLIGFNHPDRRWAQALKFF